MANFIPEGEDNSVTKRPYGARARNFIPDPNDAEELPRPGADAAFVEAEAASRKRQTESKVRLWGEAVARMATLPSNNAAVGFLLDLPPKTRECFLLAEESHANRGDILGYFPAVGHTARAYWADVAEPATPKPRATKGKAKVTP